MLRPETPRSVEKPLVQAPIKGPLPRNCRQLTLALCRRIDRTNPDGELIEMMAKAAMLKMHSDGLITLLPRQGLTQTESIAFIGATEMPLLIGYGTSSLPAIITSAAGGCSGPSSTTSSGTPTAPRWPCSTSWPRGPDSWHRGFADQRLAWARGGDHRQ